MPIFRLRLSPSGPFVEGDPGEPLEVGPGTPGLVWRAQATGATATDFAVSPGVSPAGMELLAWAIPPGYHYDVELDVQLINSQIGDTIACVVEYSEDNAATWLPGADVGITRTQTFVETDTADFLRFQEVDFDRTAPGTAPITHVRVRMIGPGTSSFRPAACALRIWQYVW